MPYRHVAKARIRQARPTTAISQASGLLAGRLGGVGELRRALRHQRVALADERRALLVHRDDDLAALAERVGHGADVAHRHGLRAVAVADTEGLAAGDVADRAVHDLAGQLVGAAARGARCEL